MRRSARDFVQKPWDNERLVATVRTQIELGRALRQSQRLQAENELLHGGDVEMIADSDAMQPVIEMVNRVAPSPANVLIITDNGPGLANTANLFVPFFTTKPKGSGIGLALSRQIVEQHGGHLDLKNRPETAGCLATVRLPLN